MSRTMTPAPLNPMVRASAPSVQQLPPIRVGCDVCQIVTIREMLASDPGTLERLFSVEERAYAMATARPEQHLAGIFAAKEALAKAVKIPAALGKYYREVTIIHQEDGAPALSLSKALAGTLAQRDMQVLDVSISHDGDYAMAIVLVALAGGSPAAAGGVPAGKEFTCNRCQLSLAYLANQHVTDILIPVVDVKGAVHHLCPACLRGW